MTLQELIDEARSYGLSPDSVIVRIPGDSSFADALTCTVYAGTTISDTEQANVEHENILFLV